MFFFRRRRRLGGVAVQVVALLAAVMIFSVLPVSTPEAQAYTPPAPYTIGFQTPARINKLIYPTLGNPAIVKKGTEFVVEFDPREGVFYKDAAHVPLPACTEFSVSVATTNGGNGTISRSLPVAGAQAGYSTAWPELKYAPGPVDRRVYLVTVTVPYTLPEDLYDVTVTCKIDGATYSDTQTNSLSAVKEFKERFSVVQMSDIHVFGPECNYPSSNQKERSPRSTTWSPANGYGSTFYHKAIQQVNRIKPDFVVFTGDYMFGQKYWWQSNSGRGYGSWGDRTEYEFEIEWFYQETQKLEVPVFIVLGNHDGYYYNFDSGGKSLEQDWFSNWRKLFGPLYFSFNYGQDNKFFALNSMDWSSDMRTLTNYLNIIMQPVKYKGAFRSGGDTYAAGVDWSRVPAESTFTGQLAWFRDQLKASQGAKSRVCIMHHDPWKLDGSGAMWSSGEGGWMEAITGLLDMGNGPGRLAAAKLMKDYKVCLMLHGHDHSDVIGTIPWTAGGGQVISANSTSTSFQSAGSTNEYPGYRRVWINNGTVENAGEYNYNYINPRYTWPFYKDTNIEGSTNLGNLSTPAFQQSWSATPGPATEDVTCTLYSWYNHSGGRPVKSAYMEFPMKYLSGGYYYELTNGSFGETFNVSPTVRMNQVYTDVNAGQTKAVRVRKSTAPDTTAPTGTVSINGGAATTDSRNVTLALGATDAVAGVGEMMISNSSGFTGGEWESYRTSRAWQLSAGDGAKTVYVKYRDRAMPGNVSQVAQATITYQEGSPDTPRIVSVSPSSADRGLNLDVTITGYNTSFVNGTTNATFSGDGITIYSTRVNSPTECVANIEISNTATPGPRDVGVTGGAAVQPMADGFTVLGPMVTSVTPSGSLAGKTLDVEITAVKTNFVNGVSRAQFLRKGTEMPEVKVNSSTVTSKTRMTANITIDAGCASGPCDVGVYTPGEPTAPLQGGFVVSENAKTWYLAEGCTNGGFETWVLVQNPGDKEANVTYEYMTTAGRRDGPRVKVPPRSRLTVFVADFVPDTWDVSTKVTSDRDVIVERAMYGNNKAWGHESIGVTSPASTWYLAEGCTNGGFETWVVVQNPGGTEANVAISYMTDRGPVAGPNLSVPANSRRGVNVADVVPDTWEVSTKVTSDRPVIAERSVYGAGKAWGHNSIGVNSPSTTWYLAEGSTRGGSETWVLVQNPGNVTANAVLTFMTSEGQVPGPVVTVPPLSRKSVNVAETVPETWDVSTKVTSDQPVITERSMYGNGRSWGTDSVGVTGTAKTWYLAEGSTKGGFETWIVVQNPGDQAANVKFTYMTTEGKVDGPAVKVEAGRRKSIHVADTVPDVWSVSTMVTSDRPVIAERAMYGAGREWGHVSMGFAP